MDAVVNGTEKSFSFSDRSLLADRNTRFLVFLTMCPVTSLNSLSSSSSGFSFVFSFEDSLGFSMYRIMSSVNKNNFTSSFPK